MKTETSTALVPSIFAIKMLFILNTFPEEDAFARTSVVKVVVNAACTDLAVIVATFTRFGAAIIYSPCTPFNRKLMPLQ